MSYQPNKSPPPRSPSPQRFACAAKSTDRGAVWIFSCGELDLATSPEFQRVLREALASSRLVIVDLRQLTFIDSTGIHRIVEAAADARSRKRRLVFVRGPAQVDDVFELAGLSDRLRIIDLKAGVVPARLPRPEPAGRGMRISQPCHRPSR